MTTITENPLIVALEKSNLDEQKSVALKEKFNPVFQIVEEWKQKSAALIITDISQKPEIAMAKEAYKSIKNIRIDIEKTRKSLKEESLKEGKAIDEIAKLLTGLVAPLEEDLEQKAKFVEIYEAKVKAERTANRVERASIYGEVSAALVADMTDEIFESYLLGLRIKFEEEAKAFAEAEEARKLKEEQDTLHEKRKEQLLQFWFIMTQEEQTRNYGLITELEFLAVYNELEDTLLEHEKEQERLRKEAETQRLENDRLKAEAEQQAKENAEKLRKQQEEAERKAKENADKLRQQQAEAKAEQDRLKAEAEQARLKAEEERNAEIERIKKETESQRKKQQEEFEKQRQEERRIESERREALEKVRVNSISIDKDVLAKLEQKAIIYDSLMKLGYVTIEDIQNCQNGIPKRIN